MMSVWLHRYNNRCLLPIWSRTVNQLFSHHSRVTISYTTMQIAPVLVPSVLQVQYDEINRKDKTRPQNHEWDKETEATKSTLTKQLMSDNAKRWNRTKKNVKLQNYNVKEPIKKYKAINRARRYESLNQTSFQE